MGKKKGGGKDFIYLQFIDNQSYPTITKSDSYALMSVL
jgi:hypothetical protein